MRSGGDKQQRARWPGARLGLIRFGGRINSADPVSSFFVEESLQGLGGVGISSRRAPVDAGEPHAAI
jgi:hypothetical protein